MAEDLVHTNRGTWIAHTLITAATTLVGAVLAHAPGALAVAWITAGVYVVREHLQRRTYRRAGRYGSGQRDDRVGDVVGPLALAAGVTLGWLAGVL